MTRRNTKRYLGNKNTIEVHDLDRETTQCQIDEIIATGHAVYFTPDTVDQAHRKGFDNCVLHWGINEVKIFCKPN